MNEAELASTADQARASASPLRAAVARASQ
jgi:hypothetical protein